MLLKNIRNHALTIPQFGDVVLPNGEIEIADGYCLRRTSPFTGTPGPSVIDELTHGALVPATPDEQARYDSMTTADLAMANPQPTYAELQARTDAAVEAFLPSDRAREAMRRPQDGDADRAARNLQSSLDRMKAQRLADLDRICGGK